MELTQAYKHKTKAKATLISICTFLRLFLLGYASKNTTVFEGLVRNTTPFGGNWLPLNQQNS